MLVLDDPTNDLDIETLDLLKALLCEYRGIVINLATSTLVFEDNCEAWEYLVGYDDWERQRKPNETRR